MKSIIQECWILCLMEAVVIPWPPRRKRQQLKLEFQWRKLNRTVFLLTGGRGITFATGTPISNSMTELYTNMRYLQYNTLQRLGLGHFDSWAASFGETQTAIELAPEGTGYRAKTRFAKFFNLPELIALFKRERRHSDTGYAETSCAGSGL